MKTDMNERERARFRAGFRKMAESAIECADALELEDDGKFIISYIIFGMAGAQLTDELKPILEKAATEAGIDTSKSERDSRQGNNT